MDGANDRPGVRTYPTGVSSPAPTVPQPTPRIPIVALWFVPFAMVLVYVLLVNEFFHSYAHWTGDKIVGATITLLGFTALFSLLWFCVAYLAALGLGDVVTFGILALLARIPGVNRHVIVTPPARADRSHEVWGRFGILLFITVGYELIFLLLIVQRGDLAPNFIVDRPIRFFPDVALAGVGLGLLIAPAAPFLGSRVRTRISDSLEFPLLWLAALLLVLGGSSVVLVEVLPGFVFNTALFLTSILLYAPAAWYVSLAFSHTEVEAQDRFLARAWRSRGGRFHFGRLKVTDEPEGTTEEI